MITIAYINFWEDSNNDDYFTKFISYNIGETKLVKLTDNPDILIASVFGNINNVSNIQAKCKIFYYGENLNRFPPYNNDSLLENTFDLIIGFKYTNLNKENPSYHTYKKTMSGLSGGPGVNYLLTNKFMIGGEYLYYRPNQITPRNNDTAVGGQKRKFVYSPTVHTVSLKLTVLF